MKKKKVKLILVGIIFLFSGYLLFISISYENNFVHSQELLHQKFLPRLPYDLSFAGEVVHFKNEEAYRNFYSELRYHTRNESSTRYALKNAGIWFPIIEKILKENKMPDDLKYVALAESNLSNAVSPMGAVGFWQFTRITGMEFGLEISDEVDQRLDPIKSTKAACKYFKKMYHYFGSWTSAAAAYNYGETALFFAFRNQRVNSYYDLDLNHETSSYLFRILAMKDLIRNPKKYGIKMYRRQLPPVKSIKIEHSIFDLTLFAQLHGISYAQLVEMNPWILKKTLTVEPGKSYFIDVPK